MLRFEVHNNKEIDLCGAYLFGQEGVPIRAEIATRDGGIVCEKRAGGSTGLALLWDAGAPGRLLLPTCRLSDSEQPYNLNLELARAQTMRIAQKREDWGLFDFADAEAINAEYEAVRGKFITALKARRSADAAAMADEALAEGLVLGEKMALYHAEIFINRRKASGGASMRIAFGCATELSCSDPSCQERLKETFDFLSIPMPWKHIEPKEGSYEYDLIDAWTSWAAGNKKAVHAGPLLNFHSSHLPDWLYLWENDYDTMREMVYDHIQRTVKRYQKSVHYWRVVSGLHAFNNFNLSFEQLMELTRMTCQLVKKLSPRSQVVVEMVMPWSEYYARNQRSIPLLLYADMAVQSGVKFDAFGLQFCLGVPADGHLMRDLLQISSMLDEFLAFGKPLHITACQTPSEIVSDTGDAWSGQAEASRAGQWHAPWSQRLQAEWLQAFYRISLSKPFVESICWRDLSDATAHYIPHGGLLDDHNEPKLAYKELRNFRASLLNNRVAVMNQQRRNHGT